ncbi:hypothetical protein [Salinarimonas chemoclinalis]|uniref:hypothetical protein n=1 Tax=Salinarimonas chemoclinalis TaxID=3241599 RepID=UPI0035567536
MSSASATTRPDLPDDGYYNPTFETLDAMAANPAAAALAYYLYKSGKRQRVTQFRRAHGRAPSEADLRSHAATQTDEVLRSYLARAGQILNAVGETAIAEAEPHILRRALQGRNWASFWVSLAATFVFTGILAAVVGIAAIMGFGLPISFSVGPELAR